MTLPPTRSAGRSDMRFTRDQVDFWGYAALFSLFLGTFSIFGTLNAVSPGAASGAMLLWLGVTWLGAGLTLLHLRRLPLPGALLMLLGLMPYGYFAWLYLTGAPMVGAFSYFYKFSSLLLFPVVYLWCQRRSDARIEGTLMLLATVLAVRVLVAFAVPGLFPGRAGNGQAALWDDVTIYERIGPMARVFYPGVALQFFALIVSVERALTRQEGMRLEVARAALFLCALLFTLTRGFLLTAAALVALYVAVRWLTTHVSQRRRVRLLTGLTLLGLGGAVVIATTPAGMAVTRLAEQYAGQERFSLDGTNIDWRAEQAQLAFTLIQTPEQRWLGVGTNVTIPEDIKAPNPWETTGELHYSFHSVQWTFGYVGLNLLIWGGLALPLLSALRWRLRSPLALALLTTLAFIAVIGSYTIVFTNADWNFMLVTCGAFLLARAQQAEQTHRWFRAPPPTRHSGPLPGTLLEPYD
ncbi:O-antigen ligase family protein [Deinococcus sp. A31D244]|uniref:O-antigen ligase family protein n=1 Tax=Deinococcus sp. A31D244 TaxID=3397675 RepID=UPI0039E12047